MHGSHFGDPPGKKRYGYVPPCRVCGMPVWHGTRQKGRGLVCGACDRRSLAEMLSEARDDGPEPFRKAV